jgi:hypothetical protein
MILVEGDKTEPKILKRMLDTYKIDINYELQIYHTNIYVLYNEMFRDGEDRFNALDLLQVLKSKEKDETKRQIFDEKYSDILLIFDLDPQDREYRPERIRLMQEYFCESTDMGKLYINYPMSEAFYHMPDIPDATYNDKTVCLKGLTSKSYRTLVNSETRGHDYTKFIKCREDLTTVILQNLSKALYISTSETVDWQEFKKTERTVDSSAVLDGQLKLLSEKDLVYVLCSCVFYIVDNSYRLLME